jgi:Carboxypeptidase regulatory-like domain
MCKRLPTVLFVVLMPLMASSAVLAQQTGQSAIAGLVKDATGAVLPGVTVEASSPVLIEKSHTAVTNGSGQYRVVDLTPGTYTVTFTLAGFATIIREGIVLEANFVAPINVEMKVGTVEQRVTVTAESPVVDVQSSQRREVVPQLLIASLPTANNFEQVAATVPAVLTGSLDVGGSTSMWIGGSLLVHGSLSQDSRVLTDGMVVDAMFGNGECACFYDNEAQTQEFSVTVTGGSAENQLSGVLINRVPRTGSNTFHGEYKGVFANGSMEGVNSNATLQAEGLGTPQKLTQTYDINYSQGGPILTDRLWFFVSGRNWAYNNYVAGAFNSDGSQATTQNSLKAFPARLTAQLSAKNKLTTMFDWGNQIVGNQNLSNAVSPAATVTKRTPADHIGQAKWTSTITSHLLFETGYSTTFNGISWYYSPLVTAATCFTAYNLCPPGTSFGSIPHVDTSLGTSTVAAPSTGAVQSGPEHMPELAQNVVTSLSYVTGAHAFKVGFQDRWGWQKNQFLPGPNAALNQYYRNGVPYQVIEFNTPVQSEVDVTDLGIYVQDLWTTKRLTLSPGLRFDYFNSGAPAENEPAGRFVPARQFAAASNLADWKDVSPRIGVAYDLFGDGKTAIKGSIGRFVQSEGPTFASTYLPEVFSTNTCSWTDLNHDDVAADSEITGCTNNAFGLRVNHNPAAGISRPYQWVSDIGLQHQLLAGVGLSVSYNRRVYHDIIWTQNLAAPYSAYTLNSVNNPMVSGQTVPIYSINPANLGQINEIDNNSSNNRMWYQGVDTSVDMRWHNLVLKGGTSTGRTLSVTCDVTDPNSMLYCDQTAYHVPFRTLVRVSGTYQLPFAIRVSAVAQSIPGNTYNITYVVTKAALPSLTQSSVTQLLAPPNTLFYDTVNQLDLNLSKTVRVRGIAFRPEVGLFNLLNASPIAARTTTFGPNLNKVTTILPARLIRVTMTANF